MQNAILKSLLSAANLAYDSGELQIDEDLPRGHRGDTLADFVSFEIRDVTQGYEDFELAAGSALGAMRAALSQLQSVISALESVDAPSEMDVTDCHLTGQQLKQKYDDLQPGEQWAEHPLFSHEDWSNEATALNTLLGYWDWVSSGIEQHFHELEADVKGEEG